MTERKHHDFSPSQLQALEACPSYEGAQTQSEAAETGTRQHAVAESGRDDETLSDEAVAAVAEALAFVAAQKQILEEARTREVNSALARLGGTVAEAEAAVPSVLDLREVYLPADEENTTAGTADRILVSSDRRRAVLIDYKMGKWPVELAVNNRQSDAYTVAVFHAYPTVESVEVHFFQPAVKAPNNTVWLRKDIPELLLRIKTIVARAKLAREKGDFSTAAPHTPVCLFCKHLAVCPAVAAKVISVARKFSPVEVQGLDLTPTKVHAPENAAEGKRLVALVKAWAEAYDRLILDRCLRGGPVPTGYRLTSRTTREIVDSAAFKRIALEYLTPEEIETTIEIGMTKIEKLIAQKAPRGMKTATIEAFQSETEGAGAVQEKAPFAFLKAKTSED